VQGGSRSKEEVNQNGEKEREKKGNGSLWRSREDIVDLRGVRNHTQGGRKKKIGRSERSRRGEKGGEVPESKPRGRRVKVRT